ncbi:MAG: YheU family protein [Terriglobales bacterium]
MNEYEDLPPHVVGAAEHQEAVAVPHAELSADALVGVIKAFVLREGTDYGEHEVTLEQKIAQVRAQLENGDARILFDPSSATVDIVRIPGRGR